MPYKNGFLEVFRDNFFEIVDLVAEEMLELISNFELKLRTSSLKLSLAVLPASTSKFCHDLLHPSRAEIFGEWVGGGVPPLGVSIRRPTKSCHRRAGFISNWLCPITAGQSRHSFEQFVRAIRSEVFFPLSFPFPRSLGTTANPTPKSGKVWFFRIFGRFFRLPKRAWKMTSKKHRKKCENQGFWPPKPLPKPS